MIIKALLYTLGCKVNQYETQAISEELVRNGFEIVAGGETADVIVVNSCTVTAESDRKTRQAVRKFKRSFPDALVVLTGCFPQAFPEDAALLTQADLVIGNKNNTELVGRVLKMLNDDSRRTVDICPHTGEEPFSDMPITEFEERTRAVVKIEDGCNRFCSYCIIPYARGRVRSKPPAALKNEIAALAANGYREIVLVGINLSAYGSDLGLNLCDAVELACAQDGIERVRLGSLEPDHITAAVIARLKNQAKLCPHFHISLQSGCDKTLRRMNRHYTCEEYSALCDALRSSFEGCALTTDIMVGFPGESDDDFNESLAFARKIGFEKIHVFPYSPRKGTKAAALEQLSKQAKEKRARIMLNTAAEIRGEYLRRQIGKTVRVLLESKERDGSLGGYTANYTPVSVATDQRLCGKTVKIKITAVYEDSCLGEICE